MFFKLAVFCLGGIFFTEIVNVVRSGRHLARMRSDQALWRHALHLIALTASILAIAGVIAWYAAGAHISTLHPALRMADRILAVPALVGLATTLWFNGLRNRVRHRQFAYPTVIFLLLVGAAGVISWWRL